MDNNTMNGTDDAYYDDYWNVTDSSWNNSTNSTNSTDTTTTTTESESKILRNTFVTYGSAFAILALLFCILRRRYPTSYNLRSWVPDLQTSLALKGGLFSWAWQSISDDVFLQECGMDALCLTRVCTLGIHLCMVGMGCAVVLLPLYYTAPTTEETEDITDPVVQLTTAHVGPGSNRFIATALACYVIFGYSMYLIHSELEQWFSGLRYQFLTQKKARNYAIYLYNIPEQYRSNQAVQHFLENSLNEQCLEAHVARKITNLSKEVAGRESTVLKLEHAVAVEECSGARPTHRASVLDIVPGMGAEESTKVDSIDFYAQELKAENEDITERINVILEQDANRELPADSDDSDDDDEAIDEDDVKEESSTYDKDESTDFFSFVKSSAVSGVTNAVSGVKDNGTNLTSGLINTATRTSLNLLGKNEDGEPFSAGFVVFPKLSTVHTALQINHASAYQMECLEAPDPDDILWHNVGRQHKDLELGRLFSMAATVVLCVFWTIPVTFVNSLSSVESLRSEVGWIDDMLTAAPWLVPFFELLAPQFLVILNALLPVVLEIFAHLEGPISGAIVEASMFTKLSLFAIIQTFFVSAVGGAFLQEVNQLIESSNVTDFINAIAKALPAKSTFFIQMAVVMTVTTFAMEALRVVPIVKAALRRYIGPRLTEKERQTAFLGLSPLNDPDEMEQADYLSSLVLFFIIFLVYAVIAPLVSFVLGLCFMIMGVLFRHQFVYIYPTTPDSGGVLYLNLIKVLLGCLLIGEITILVLLGLKQSAVGSAMMFPLIIVTVLFNTYIRKKHFSVAEHLPSRLCLKQDRKNANMGMDYSFVEEAYLQPELREKEVLPELPHDQLQSLGLIPTKDEEEAGVVHEEAVPCRVTNLSTSFRVQ